MFMDGLKDNLEQLFSLIRRCAICNFHSHRLKVKVLRTRQVVLGQPSGVNVIFDILKIIVRSLHYLQFQREVTRVRT